ncbi:MAG: hypothetical protein AAF265_13170 [Pseudomonadota bacterium]
MTSAAPHDQYSKVTAVLPVNNVDSVMQALLERTGAYATTWQARGTLLREQWWQKYLPPISPAKSIVQFLAPVNQAPALVGQVVETSNLNRQATGAVFSNVCDRVIFGSDFRKWPNRETADTLLASHTLTDHLNIIFCTVSHHLSPRVSKAAIEAGAHGPIVYYSEGRGLRDRLGWLRITKDHEKEVLMVVAEAENAQRVFDAMAKSGEFHLPGRGFMYRLIIDRGMFHLASRVSHHHHRANMQQIIRAIDHLSGHTHWRDHTAIQMAIDERTNVTAHSPSVTPYLHNQTRLSAICPSTHSNDLMDFFLECGVPGLSLHYGQTLRKETDGEVSHTEYALLQSVVATDTADHIFEEIDHGATENAFDDLCVFSHRIPEVACYVPGRKGYRKTDRGSAAA